MTQRNQALTRHFSIFWILGASLLCACGGGSRASASGASSSSGRANVEWNGHVQLAGALDYKYTQASRGSSFAPEPYQDTWALRLRLRGGPDEWPGVILDIDDLPADLGEGTWTLGSGNLRLDLHLSPSDPAASGLRFQSESGTVQLEKSGGKVRGRIEAVLEESSFKPRDQRRTISLVCELEGVPVQD